jgi:alpha-tubulin suppressor-like RCC1 family protein
MPNQFNSPEGDLENYFITQSWLIDQWVGDTLWNWGWASRLGAGDGFSGSRISTPITTFSGGTNWKQVSSSLVHTAAIKTDGTLWTWGDNNFAQLGDNTTTNRSIPVTTFLGGTNWKQVSCGDSHTAAIKTDGTLWTWGYNSNGQLGINLSGVSNGRTTPVTTFLGGTTWKQVACGEAHTAAIKTDGILWTWGYNVFGQLGDNTRTQRNTPVQVFGSGTNWKQVACGHWHTAAIKTDGTLWTWGEGGDGKLGHNASSSHETPITTFLGGTNWKQISCGYNSTSAIKTDGTLWTWGLNDRGQLGDNTTTNRSIPVTTFAGGTNWKQVSDAKYSKAAIKTDGTLWICGSNAYGELGVNDNNTRCTPVTTFTGGTNWKQVAASRFTTAAVTSGTDPTYFIS